MKELIRPDQPVVIICLGRVMLPPHSGRYDPHIWNLTLEDLRFAYQLTE
jgi:hypothetical protein